MERLHYFVFRISSGRRTSGWWIAGGLALWKEAQTRAGNINRWSKTDVLAIPKSDPFGTFARFAETPGWTESEPLAVQEIEADSKEEAADKLFDLGVTRENLWALDLGVKP